MKTVKDIWVTARHLAEAGDRTALASLMYQIYGDWQVAYRVADEIRRQRASELRR